MNPPKIYVTVIMAAYNARQTLDAAIESVRQQSWDHWNLIVVNDASVDGTRTLLDNWHSMDQRIRVLHREINGGPAQARNAGLELAQDEYIAFLDADDIWHPSKLEIQLKAMCEQHHDLTYCEYLRIPKNRPYAAQHIRPPLRVDQQRLLRGNCILLSTSMLRRSRLGALRFAPVPHEDYVYWYAALQQVPEAHLVGNGQALVRYQVASDSVSGNKLRAARWHWHNLYRDFRLPFMSALNYFVLYAWDAVARACHCGASWQFPRRISR
ncbi:MAG: glycosyltransferase family 2 protein [Rhodoferax sp.]|nr:glycosyltransferase family 2 protein [Rhodoferax sp.]